MSLPLYKDLVQAEYDATLGTESGSATLSWRCICASAVLKRLNEDELAEVMLSWEVSTKEKLAAWEAGVPVSTGSSSDETDLYVSIYYCYTKQR